MKKTTKQNFLLTAAVFLTISLLAVSVLLTSCIGDDDGVDDTVTIEGKFRIASWENGTLNGEDTFLFDDSGKLAIQGEADNEAQFWLVEQFNGKTRIKNVGSGNYLNMKDVIPSWGGDEALEGIAKVSSFEDIEEFFWEFIPGTGEQLNSMQIFTSKTWSGNQGITKALLSLNSIAHLAGAEPDNTAKLNAFKGTVQCRNDLDQSGRNWGTCFWVFYEFD